MCVNNLSKVALDSATAGIEPAISNRFSSIRTKSVYCTCLKQLQRFTVVLAFLF